MAGADPEKVSDRALERGKEQLGTLGSGNHFLEIEAVEEIFDEQGRRGLRPGAGADLRADPQRLRGSGYQVCDDYLARMVKHAGRSGSTSPTASWPAPGSLRPGAGLSCRDGVCGELRLGQPAASDAPDAGDLRKDAGDGAAGAWDAASLRRLPQHREDRNASGRREGGPLSAFTGRGRRGPFPPGHPDVPPAYRKAGQPVLIPGDMGTGSYVLAGTKGAFTETFGSTCHGAGRVMSRTQATKSCRGRSIPREMAERV